MSGPPPPPGAGMPGGGLLPNMPLWYPPMSVKWIATGLVIFAAAVANRFKPAVRRYFAHPLGFFLVALAAFMTFKYGFPPLAFALLFLLLNMWAVDESEGFVEAFKNRQECDAAARQAGQEAYPQFFEGFLGASDVEVVTRGKRWYVERVLKEHPEAIIDKGVQTSAVSGFSAQAGTSAGNT
jgi:hypothetical protein